jgi:hypothetical protein
LTERLYLAVVRFVYREAATPGRPLRAAHGEVHLSRRQGTLRFVDERSAQLAQNQAVFRAGNEAIDATVGGQLPKTPYLCECGASTCFERVPLTAEEYGAVRSHPARFFVLPGHEDLTAGEVVIEHFSRFLVVEKRGDLKDLVEWSDPRAPDA